MPEDAGSAIGIVCALELELGDLRRFEIARATVQGFELSTLDLHGQRALACVAGVGKVHAAHAAATLIAGGARRALFVVGTCGGLRQELGPGTLVHCQVAAQVDLAAGARREFEADGELRALWQDVAPGVSGWYLTADRPVLSLWRRLRLARAFRGACVAEMETAAVACVAQRSGVPWAALRAVTDRATWAGGLSFRLHVAQQAGRAANSLPELARRLAPRL